MTALEQIAQALEHARPNVKGAALEKEVSEALDVARRLVKEGGWIGTGRPEGKA